MASLAMSIAKSEFIVGGKYRLMRKIGSGSFGDIYLGINISNGEVSQPQASFSANLHDLLLDCCLPASSVSSVLFAFPISRFSAPTRLVLRNPIASLSIIRADYRPTWPKSDETRRETAPRHVDRDIYVETEESSF